MGNIRLTGLSFMTISQFFELLIRLTVSVQNMDISALLMRESYPFIRLYAAEHPLCEVCLAKGVYTPTEEIHHKLPLSQGGTHDRSNLMALCKECHARIHAERGDRWHNRETR